MYSEEEVPGYVVILQLLEEEPDSFFSSCILLVLTHRFTHLVHWCCWGGEGLCPRGHFRTQQDPTGASWAATSPVSFAVAPL